MLITSELDNIIMEKIKIIIFKKMSSMCMYIYIIEIYILICIRNIVKLYDH